MNIDHSYLMQLLGLNTNVDRDANQLKDQLDIPHNQKEHKASEY